MQEIDQQQKAKKVQQKIKFMMRQKKIIKLTSQKQLFNDKPPSLNNERQSKKFDQFSVKMKKQISAQNYTRVQQSFTTFSNNRIKPNIDTENITRSSEYNFGEAGKKFLWSKKEKTGPSEMCNLKKNPSVEKIQTSQEINRSSFQKLKRPSSVINKSTRATSSRSRRGKPLEPQDQKQMQEKIMQIIPKCFEYGMKLQKFAQQNKVDLGKQYQLLMGEEINFLRLVSNSRKYYSCKFDNEEQQQLKLSTGVEKEIIEMLKKKKERENVINNCENITSQIQRLINTRLSVLNKTKVDVTSD